MLGGMGRVCQIRNELSIGCICVNMNISSSEMVWSYYNSVSVLSPWEAQYVINLNSSNYLKMSATETRCSYWVDAYQV